MFSYSLYTNCTTKICTTFLQIYNALFINYCFQTKMNYLRTQYCRELCKIKESYKSGSGYDDIYTPTTYWFDDMSFLKGFVNIKKGNSSVPLVSSTVVME